MKSNSTNISGKNPLLLGDYYLTPLIMIALIMIANCDLSHKNCFWSLPAIKGLALFKPRLK